MSEVTTIGVDLAKMSFMWWAGMHEASGFCASV